MLAYNEHSGVEIEAAFFDAAGNPTQPNTVYWRLDCETTNTVLQDFTELTVSAEPAADGSYCYCAQIDIAGSLNAIQKNKHAQEQKKLLVVANKDAAGEFSQEYRYVVKNLRGRS